jgi:hypothetical protein
MIIGSYIFSADCLQVQLNNLSSEVFSCGYELTGLQAERSHNFEIQLDYDETN